MIGLIKRVHLREELFDVEKNRVRTDKLFLIGEMFSRSTGVRCIRKTATPLHWLWLPVNVNVWQIEWQTAIEAIVFPRRIGKKQRPLKALPSPGSKFPQLNNRRLWFLKPFAAAPDLHHPKEFNTIWFQKPCTRSFYDGDAGVVPPGSDSNHLHGFQAPAPGATNRPATLEMRTGTSAIYDELDDNDRRGGNALEGEHQSNDTGLDHQPRAAPSRLNPCIWGFEVCLNCAAAAAVTTLAGKNSAQGIMSLPQRKALCPRRSSSNGRWLAYEIVQQPVPKLFS